MSINYALEHKKSPCSTAILLEVTGAFVRIEKGAISNVNLIIKEEA
jgi:hypothetical protein